MKFRTRVPSVVWAIAVGAESDDAFVGSGELAVIALRADGKEVEYFNCSDRHPIFQIVAIDIAERSQLLYTAYDLF